MISKIVACLAIIGVVGAYSDVLLPPTVRQPADAVLRWIARQLEWITAFDWTRHMRHRWVLLLTFLAALSIALFDLVTLGHSALGQGLALFVARLYLHPASLG